MTLVHVAHRTETTEFPSGVTITVCLRLAERGDFSYRKKNGATNVAKSFKHNYDTNY